MPVVMHDKTMNVRERDGIEEKNHEMSILGFEDTDYYPEKHPDQRLRRERIPVR